MRHGTCGNQGNPRDLVTWGANGEKKQDTFAVEFLDYTWPMAME